MSPRFLGVRVVAVRSFARIHEANLKKQGILPLTFESPSDYDRIEERDRLDFPGISELKSGKPVEGTLCKPDGSAAVLRFRHTLTGEQIEWLRAGSALNTVRSEKS